MLSKGVWHELGKQSNATEDLIVLHGGYIPFHAKVIFCDTPAGLDVLSLKNSSVPCLAACWLLSVCKTLSVCRRVPWQKQGNLILCHGGLSLEK